MFTGIIEDLGEIVGISSEGTNRTIQVKTSFLSELKIDQSIAHNGICLTVVDIQNDSYIVQAIEETIKKTNLGKWQIGDRINLERAVAQVQRMDGHIVQGHVDETTECIRVENLDGSWDFWFCLPSTSAALMIPQGSVTINGTSLTVSGLEESRFKVSIIPYTFENTVFQDIKAGDLVNIEYDVLGKYVQRYMMLYNRKGAQ